MLSPLLFDVALELRAERAVVVETGDTTIDLKARHVEELSLEQVLALHALILLHVVNDFDFLFCLHNHQRLDCFLTKVVFYLIYEIMTMFEKDRELRVTYRFDHISIESSSLLMKLIVNLISQLPFDFQLKFTQPIKLRLTK